MLFACSDLVTVITLMALTRLSLVSTGWDGAVEAGYNVSICLNTIQGKEYTG